MKTREQVLAEHAKELALFERNELIVSKLGIEPRYISNSDSKFPWVSYHVKNLKEAIELAKKLQVEDALDVTAVRSGCLSIQPFGEHGDRYNEDKDCIWSIGNCICFEYDLSDKYTFSKLSYWLDGAKVIIDIECLNLEHRPSFRTSYGKYGEARIQDKVMNQKLRAAATKHVSWGGCDSSVHDAFYFGGITDLEELANA